MNKSIKHNLGKIIGNEVENSLSIINWRLARPVEMFGEIYVILCGAQWHLRKEYRDKLFNRTSVLRMYKELISCIDKVQYDDVLQINKTIAQHVESVMKEYVSKAIFAKFENVEVRQQIGVTCSLSSKPNGYLVKFGEEIGLPKLKEGPKEKIYLIDILRSNIRLPDDKLDIPSFLSDYY
ncbi:hypothetical protein DRJ17_01265 [Candidatus Woesearchaeota archaeon]|nr:MAG: hypothetical protein DRJ17_01265 [Candidatus Woesearchaeota archaeon]